MSTLVPARWVRDMLLRVGVCIALDTIREWSAEQRFQAEEWAVHEYLAAENNPVPRLPRPKFLAP